MNDLAAVNNGLDVFEKGLNICGYFNYTGRYTAPLRFCYGLSQIIISFAVPVIFGIGVFIANRLGNNISTQRPWFVLYVLQPYLYHGVVNCTRAIFESHEEFGPIMFVYDLGVSRYSYSGFFEDLPEFVK